MCWQHSNHTTSFFYSNFLLLRLQINKSAFKYHLYNYLAITLHQYFFDAMLKQITAAFLLMVILLQILNRAVIYVDYYTNTAAYFKNCENKAKLSMHCNGKCQMIKKIQQQEKDDQQHPGKRSGMDEVISAKSFYAAAASLSFPATQTYFLYNDNRICAMPRAYFHPPGV